MKSILTQCDAQRDVPKGIGAGHSPDHDSYRDRTGYVANKKSNYKHMKQIIIILIFSCLILGTASAQNQENKLMIEEYLQQSEKQKKAGLIMIGAGAGTAGLGILLAANSNSFDSPAFGGGIILFLAGSASTVIGVPIIISSASKARKAAQLSIGAKTTQLFIPDNPSNQAYPTLNISIPLNSAKR
jgi:hypothetical protein